MMASHSHVGAANHKLMMRTTAPISRWLSDSFVSVRSPILTAGIPPDNGIWLSVSGDHGACGHNRARSNFDAWQHNRSGAQPHIVFDDDLRSRPTLISNADSTFAPVVVLRVDRDEGPEHDVTPDLDAPSRMDEAVTVGTSIIANRDVFRMLEPAASFQPDVFPDLPEGKKSSSHHGAQSPGHRKDHRVGPLTTF
jgi:hypothetical protein